MLAARPLSSQRRPASGNPSICKGLAPMLVCACVLQPPTGLLMPLHAELPVCCGTGVGPLGCLSKLDKTRIPIEFQVSPGLPRLCDWEGTRNSRAMPRILSPFPSGFECSPRRVVSLGVRSDNHRLSPFNTLGELAPEKVKPKWRRERKADGF